MSHHWLHLGLKSAQKDLIGSFFPEVALAEELRKVVPNTSPRTLLQLEASQMLENPVEGFR